MVPAMVLRAILFSSKRGALSGLPPYVVAPAPSSLRETERSSGGAWPCIRMMCCVCLSISFCSWSLVKASCISLMDFSWVWTCSSAFFTLYSTSFRKTEAACRYQPCMSSMIFMNWSPFQGSMRLIFWRLHSWMRKLNLFSVSSHLLISAA